MYIDYHIYVRNNILKCDFFLFVFFVVLYSFSPFLINVQLLNVHRRRETRDIDITNGYIFQNLYTIRIFYFYRR